MSEQIKTTEELKSALKGMCAFLEQLDKAESAAEIETGFTKLRNDIGNLKSCLDDVECSAGRAYFDKKRLEKDKTRFRKHCSLLCLESFP